MVILGFLAILLMGITLSLLGAGGSILTVPILVYFFKVSPVLSTSYSLLLVGFTALIGSMLYLKSKQIDFNIALKFVVPSVIAVYLTRRYLLPIIPAEFEICDQLIKKDFLILLIFSVTMLIASIFMITNSDKAVLQNQPIKVRPLLKNIMIIIEASLVGVLTALIGAGGGFLIVPALVLLNKINIKSAIGSSLLIIATKSLIGFIGDLQNKVELDYFLAMNLMILAAIGMFLGTIINRYIDPKYLKKAFGYFVMLVAILIIIKETI